MDRAQRSPQRAVGRPEVLRTLLATCLIALAVTPSALTHAIDRNATQRPTRAVFELQLTFDPDKASIDELQLLPGIGPALARHIVSYRSSVPAPAFVAPEDLIAVPRIGPRIAERLAPYWNLPTQHAGDTSIVSERASGARSAAAAFETSQP